MQFKLFDLNRNGSLTVTSFWFNNECLMYLCNLSSGERNELLFQYADHSCKMGLENLENCVYICVYTNGLAKLVIL